MGRTVRHPATLIVRGNREWLGNLRETYLIRATAGVKRIGHYNAVRACGICLQIESCRNSTARCSEELTVRSACL
jgi:hypothetical protein